MPAFEYQACDTAGRKKNGVLEADTARQVRQQLRDMQLTPLSVAEIEQSRQQSQSGVFSRSRISISQLAMLTRQIATLIGAGQPVEKALGAIAKQNQQRKLKHLVLNLRSQVLEGHSLSQALAQFPNIFDALFVATVQAGEQSGLLDQVLEQLADHVEARQQFQNETRTALIYPVILILVSILLVSGLLTYVVPQIVQVFEGFDQELPWITQQLIALSEFLIDYGLPLLGILIGGSMLLKWLQKIDSVRLLRDLVLLRLPILGGWMRLADSARFIRTLGILVSTGVPALDALKIARDVVQMQPIAKAIGKATESVREGESISRALERSQYFSPLVLNLIENGEASGRLGEMLMKSSDNQESELKTTTSVFLGLFEPIMILLMGMIVLVIVLAILLPVFDMNDLLQ